MNRLVRGSIMFVAAAGAWACKTNLGENADVTDHLVATPSVVLVSNTDSQSVDVEALNPEGQQLPGDFVASNVGAGIVVRQDTAFLPVPGGHSPVRARFVVRGIDSTTFVSTSFTVTANGKRVVVGVAVFPVVLTAVTLSNAAPAIGDTVQLTAAAGIRFTSATTITTPADTSRRLANVGISADSTILFILPGPDIANRALQLGNVQVTYNPGQNFTVPTDASITTGPLPAPLPNVTASSNAPAVGDTVVLTAPPIFGFTANSRVTLVGAGNAFVDVSADHATLRFVIGPNSTGVATVSNVALGGVAALGTVNLTTAAPVTTPPPPPLAATYSNATPIAGEQVVMTAPAAYRFLPTATATVGGVLTFKDSVSADSTKLYFVPRPGTTGNPSVGNVVLSFLTSVPLTVSATTPLTVAPSPFPGTSTLAAAPIIPFPASGNAITVWDGGTFAGTALGFPTRWYKIVVPVDAVVDLDVTWNNTDDLGLYVFDAAVCSATACGGAAIVDAADNLGGGASGHPEHQGGVTLPAGTYYLGMLTFNAAAGPGVFNFTITTQ